MDGELQRAAHPSRPLVFRQDADADLTRQRRTGAAKTGSGQGCIDDPADSFDPADTHHARSTICQIKSRFLQLMAQIGSFVPAQRARIGVVDKLFSRIGASDDLAAGRSTFMVEMLETAAILNQATPRSLVILDEVGRGTSTHDGLAIAQAAMEHLHDLGCRTLFSTHYHELAAATETMPHAVC